MTEKRQVYKCNVCGNITEVLHPGQGELVCCNQPMQLQAEQTQDPEVGEKHVPVLEKGDKSLKVKVGETLHPMDEDHYIEWIELNVDGRVYRKFLKPGDSPEVTFPLRGNSFEVRAYCNVHGLWESNQ